MTHRLADLRLIPVLVTMLLVSGCSLLLPPPQIPTVPSPLAARPGERIRFAESTAAEPNRPYKIDIGTHCGVGGTPIDFDGAFWTPAEDLPEPVPGLRDPFDTGTLTLTAPANAVFVSSGGVRIELVRQAGPRAFVLCR